MDGGSWLQVLLFILLVIFGAYFGAAESAYSSVNKIKLKNFADNEDGRARTAMYIVNNFECALTTLLIGNNITKIACASLATVFAMKLITGPNPELLSTILTTAIVFLLCEMIPKSYANSHSQSVSLSFAVSLRFLMKLLFPLTLLFSGISKALTKLFTKPEEPSITEDELFNIIENNIEEGSMPEEQSDLFKSALEYTETTVGEVMTVREDITAVGLYSSVTEILDKIKSVKYSRLPVYGRDLDDIVGLLNTKVFFKAYIKKLPINIKEMLSETRFISPDAFVDETLRSMSRQKIYMSVVRENGRTLGIVTMEDFLEELVGEIWDEDDTIDYSFMKLGGTRFDVAGTLTVGEMLEKTGLVSGVDEKTEESLSGKSVSQFAAELLGHTPKKKDEFQYGSFEMVVSEANESGALRLVIKYNYTKKPLTNPLDIEVEGEAGKSGADGKASKIGEDGEDDVK